MKWAAVCVAMVLATAGCSGGPDGPDPEAFCETWEADTGQIPEDSGQWKAHAETWEDLAILAPEDISDAVKTYSEAIGKVAETADGGEDWDLIYEEPGTSAAYDEIAAWTSEHCMEGGGYFPGG